MCLGIPGQIVQRWDEGGAPMARVDFAGEERRICLAYLPDLAVGEYVIAHMGFALTRVDADTARSTTALMREYGVLPADQSAGQPREQAAAADGTGSAA